jgi:hypothetical protein
MSYALEKGKKGKREKGKKGKGGQGNQGARELGNLRPCPLFHSINVLLCYTEVQIYLLGVGLEG